MCKYVLFILILFSGMVNSQNDTIQMKNNTVLKGEIKSFSEGVLIMETSFSDSDFKIEFKKIKSISIQRPCTVILTNGRNRFGNVKTDVEGFVVISQKDGTTERFKLEEIIAIDEVDDNYWRRFIVSIDLGFSLNKANSLTQFSIAGDLNYTNELWLIDGNINLLNSTQDNAEKTTRTEAQLEFYRLLLKKWYLIGDISFLSNTEQALTGRISPSIGMGRFLVSTKDLYLALSLSYAYNIENYVDSDLNKTSSEAYIRTSFNMFDFEDIDLESNINFYPSLSENKRIRTDFDLTLKYDLPLDFYIKLGFTINYDNQPAIIDNEVDYVLTTGFGWDFN